MKGAAEKRGRDAIYTENKDIKISEVRTVSCRESEEGIEETRGELVVLRVCVCVCVHVFILALAACCVHPVYTYDIDTAIWWFRW